MNFKNKWTKIYLGMHVFKVKYVTSRKYVISIVPYDDAYVCSCCLDLLKTASSLF